MAKLVLPDIGTLSNQSSAREAMNNNFDLIEDALENTLSRDGTTPNQMGADLDLNGNSIINLADPVADGDAVNKRSIGSLVNSYVEEISASLIEGTARTEIFTATASQTQFPLADAPSGVDAMFVYDNGLALVPGVDFTLTGTTLQTLEFFVGRTAGHTIVARYVQLSPADSALRADLASPAADKGGALVTVYDQLAPAYLKTTSDILNGGEVEIFRFLSNLTSAERAAIWNHTSVVNHSPAFNAAVDALGGYGATLVLPFGSFNLSSQLRIDEPMNIRGGSVASRSASPDPLVGKTRLLCSDPAGGLYIKALNAGEWLHGLSFSNFSLNLQGIGNIGIHASTVAYCDFTKLMIYGATGEQMRIDDGNGNISLQNTVDAVMHHGVTAAGDAAHGLVLRTVDGNYGGTVQTQVRRLQTVTKNGHGLYMYGCDNNQIWHIHGITEGGGTGDSVYLENYPGGPGAALGTRNNRIHYLAGSIRAKANTFDNHVEDLTSEATSVVVESGAKLHYRVRDYLDSGVWETNSYKLTDSYNVPAAAMFGTAVGLSAGLWSCYTMADAVTEGVTFNVRPDAWNAGTITGLNLQLGIDIPGGAKDVRIRVRAVCTAGLAGAATPSLDQTFTVPLANINNVMQHVAVTFATPLPYARGDAAYFRVERLGADALDTANGLTVNLGGVQVNYKGTGPDSAGSGTYQTQPPGV